MPYITQAARFDMLEEMRSYSTTPSTDTAGELNYLISSILVNYILNNGLSYQSINDIIGALDGASKEFYRRVVVPYEDLKRHQNGDVYQDILAEASETSEAWADRMRKDNR